MQLLLLASGLPNLELLLHLILHWLVDRNVQLVAASLPGFLLYSDERNYVLLHCLLLVAVIFT